MGDEGAPRATSKRHVYRILSALQEPMVHLLRRHGFHKRVLRHIAPGLEFWGGAVL